MEATFVLDAREDRKELADRLTTLFKGKTIRVRVEEISSKAIDQRELFERLEAVRRVIEQVPVTLPPGVDINDIIDEINDNPL